MSDTRSLSKSVLDFDEAVAVKKITTQLKNILRSKLKKRGFVVAISGGIDSSVSAALCVKALGPNKVFGLLLPEKDSSSNSKTRGEILAKSLGIEYVTQDIGPALDALGCYKWRDDAIRSIIPEYGDGWKNKIVISGGLEGQYNHFKLVVQSPNGDMQTENLPLKEYLQIVAATNYKQRVRKTIEYFHADRLNYAVIGTPNRLEYDQGFFVKNGDGSADVKPIAHLYKTQVYAMARHLELPEDICNAVPTTDTYSLSQGQDEFYFALPFEKMDLALWAHNHNIPAKELCKVLGISVKHAQLVYSDIEVKRRTTKYLHDKAYLVEAVPEV